MTISKAKKDEIQVIDEIVINPNFLSVLTQHNLFISLSLKGFN